MSAITLAILVLKSAEDLAVTCERGEHREYCEYCGYWGLEHERAQYWFLLQPWVRMLEQRATGFCLSLANLEGSTQVSSRRARTASNSFIYSLNLSRKKY